MKSPETMQLKRSILKIDNEPIEVYSSMVVHAYIRRLLESAERFIGTLLEIRQYTLGGVATYLDMQNLELAYASRPLTGTYIELWRVQTLGKYAQAVSAIIAPYNVAEKYVLEHKDEISTHYIPYYNSAYYYEELI